MEALGFGRYRKETDSSPSPASAAGACVVSQ